MIVRVLGSAAGGGVPQWNCGCANCTRARIGDAPTRTQSAFAFGDGDVWVLVNASVDLPRQLAAAREMWPNTARATPFRAVLLTDANVDHCAGLGELRQNPGALCVASSQATKSLLASERANARFDEAPHRWIAVPEDGSDFAPLLDDAIGERFEIRAFDVPGFLPGYAGRQTWHGAVLAYAVRERSSGASALFAPVFGDVDDVLQAQVEAADVALLDGTFFADDELNAFGATKGTRSLGHLPVGGAGGTLERLAHTKGRRVFVHVNNTNPILDPASPESAEVRLAGFTVAADGESFVLG
jgi:pyrroloquinoline quinone biosynthesis protein B